MQNGYIANHADSNNLSELISDHFLKKTASNLYKTLLFYELFFVNLKRQIDSNKENQMSHFAHKPNYFFLSHTLVGFLSNKVQQAGELSELTVDLKDIFNLFHQDLASTTSNLEGIINIADNYHVGTESPEYRFISSYKIHAESNTVTFHFSPKAVQALQQGQALIAPDANSYE